uniref:Uncharacterized protein n=1 Tax=Octopus bimaculoides TaxID=37653 RepID=A0A0L8HG62_OCTBM
MISNHLVNNVNVTGGSSLNINVSIDGNSVYINNSNNNYNSNNRNSNYYSNNIVDNGSTSSNFNDSNSVRPSNPIPISDHSILDESLNPDPAQISGTPYCTAALNDATATTNRITRATSDSHYDNDYTSHNTNIINNNVDIANRSSISNNGRKNRGSETLNTNRGNNNNSYDSVGVDFN